MDQITLLRLTSGFIYHYNPSTKKKTRMNGSSIFFVNELEWSIVLHTREKSYYPQIE